MSIRPSATLILVRENPQGGLFETLLLRRSEKLKFAPGCWVFPGGTIEEQDYAGDADDLLAAAMRAAARETEEECGLRVPAEELLMYSHWTTPVNQGRRYATWHTVGQIREEQPVVVDGGEIDDYLWLTAEDAIQRLGQGSLHILPPTYVSLLEMAAHSSIDTFLQFAGGREAPHFQPRLITPDDKLNFENAFCVLYDGDVAYESGDMAAEGPQHRLYFKEAGYDYVNTL